MGCNWFKACVSNSSSKVHHESDPITKQPHIVVQHENNNQNHQEHQPKWAYDGECSPANWGKEYPNANGKKQSPVDIITSETVFDESLANNNLVIKYESECFRELKNNGHTILIFGENGSGTVTGGPISDSTYQFIQFHFHWGEDDSKGSEHFIDGKPYSAEIHFVNWNSNKYKKPEEALQSNIHDGLLVFAVFIKVGNENSELNKLIACLDDVKLSHQSTKLALKLDSSNLFPNDTNSYWTYSGSITTPPCNECVKWVVFKVPIEASTSQLKEFRNLYSCSKLNECCDKTKMNFNYRPVCDLNDRKILKSFSD